ncbi:MAG: hypothetical protein ACRDT2_17105 [Natronosporangium sp.]
MLEEHKVRVQVPALTQPDPRLRHVLIRGKPAPNVATLIIVEQVLLEHHVTLDLPDLSWREPDLAVEPIHCREVRGDVHHVPVRRAEPFVCLIGPPQRTDVVNRTDPGTGDRNVSGAGRYAAYVPVSGQRCLLWWNRRIFMYTAAKSLFRFPSNGLPVWDCFSMTKLRSIAIE